MGGRGWEGEGVRTQGGRLTGRVRTSPGAGGHARVPSHACPSVHRRLATGTPTSDSGPPVNAPQQLSHVGPGGALPALRPIAARRAADADARSTCSGCVSWWAAHVRAPGMQKGARRWHVRHKTGLSAAHAAMQSPHVRVTLGIGSALRTAPHPPLPPLRAPSPPPPPPRSHQTHSTWCRCTARWACACASRARPRLPPPPPPCSPAASLAVRAGARAQRAGAHD